MDSTVLFYSVFALSIVVTIIKIIFYAVWLNYIENLGKRDDIPCTDIKPDQATFLSWFLIILIVLSLSLFISYAYLLNASVKLVPYAVQFVLSIGMFSAFLYYLYIIDKASQRGDCENIARSYRIVVQVLGYIGLIYNSVGLVLLLSILGISYDASLREKMINHLRKNMLIRDFDKSDSIFS